MTIHDGASVRYDGDLPDGWDHNGRVVAVTADASGDSIATVLFDTDHYQDIPASELTLDPGDTGPRFTDWSDGSLSKSYPLEEEQ